MCVKNSSIVFQQQATMSYKSLFYFQIPFHVTVVLNPAACGGMKQK